MVKTTIKKVTLVSFALITGTAGQAVFAHTSIQHNNGASSSISVPDTGSGTTYNNIVIGHTCEQANGKYIPVIAQSVLFPTVSPLITEGSATGTVSTKTIGDLLQTSKTDTTSVASLVDYPQLIQDNDIFSAQKEKLDTSGSKVIGFEGTKGKLNNTLYGLVPFRFKGVFFKPAACIKSLNIQVAVADICKATFKTGGPVAGAANIWMPNKTTKFAQDVDGIGSPAKLTFTNTAVVTSTTDATCPNGYIDYYISPSNDDIDTNLPIKGYWNK